jgi:pimeloyl-ACP methyl ester carboxylesterase
MRRLLTSITLLLAIAIAPAEVPSARAQDASPAASPGSAGFSFEGFVDVDGRGLHLACAGAGTPTVLFEPGGPFLDGGTAAVADVGGFVSEALGVRFCSYDRAGTGQSDPHPMAVRTFREAATDLNAVLASPELACPCVVIGESMGGSIALIALAADPSGFAGLVLLDPPYPGYFDEFVELTPPGSDQASPEFLDYVGGENEERIDMAAGFRQVETPTDPPAIPMIVVAHGAGDPPPCFPEAPCSANFPVAEFEAGWQAGEAALATALGAQLVVAENTGHSIASENPELVIALTAQVIAAVRDPSTWATPAAAPSS